MADLYNSQAHSKIFIDFYELHMDSYESVIQFYEVNLRTIKHLIIEEQFTLLQEYLNACFETGEYARYVHRADEMIEGSIMHNMKNLNGHEVYLRTLFRKAASHYNSNQPEEALHICRELRKIDPSNLNYTLLERKSAYLRYPKFIQKIGGFLTLIMAMGLTLLALEIFLIYKYLPSAIDRLEDNVLLLIPAILVFWIVNHQIFRILLNYWEKRILPKV